MHCVAVFAVLVILGGCGSEESATTTGTPIDVPLTIEWVGDGEIALAVTDSVSDVSEYLVERRTGDGGWIRIIVLGGCPAAGCAPPLTGKVYRTVDVYQAFGEPRLEPDTEYCYRVTGLDGSTPAQSEEVCATTRPRADDVPDT